MKEVATGVFFLGPACLPNTSWYLGALIQRLDCACNNYVTHLLLIILLSIVKVTFIINTMRRSHVFSERVYYVMYTNWSQFFKASLFFIILTRTTVTYQMIVVGLSVMLCIRILLVSVWPKSAASFSTTLRLLCALYASAGNGYSIVIRNSTVGRIVGALTTSTIKLS